MPRAGVPHHIVIVAGDFVQTGGMDGVNYALADHLARAGREVELVAHRVAPELAAKPGISVRRAAKPLDSYMLGEPFLDHAGRRAARRAAARGGVAVLNGGNVIAPGVNWVHYVHAAYEPREPFDARGLRRRLFHLEALRRERRALGLAHTVIANSRTTQRVLIERLGVPEERTSVVYCGLDPLRFSPTSAEQAREARERLGFGPRPLVAFVGGLGDRRKGFDTLFESWRELCGRPSWDADLLAIGGGRDLERFRARARALGIAERVRLLGFRSDVDRLLGACDAFVAPARYEPYGVAVAEALARGIPALVSAAAGVAELYSSDLADLLLADPESVSELSQKLLAWRESFPTQRDRVAALSARVRAHGLEQMAAAITTKLDAAPC